MRASCRHNSGHRPESSRWRGIAEQALCRPLALREDPHRCSPTHSQARLDRPCSQRLDAPISSAWRSRAVLVRKDCPAARTALTNRLVAVAQVDGRDRQPWSHNHARLGSARRQAPRTGTRPHAAHHRTFWRTARQGVPTPPGATTPHVQLRTTGTPADQRRVCLDMRPRRFVHERRSPHNFPLQTHTGARRAPGDGFERALLRQRRGLLCWPWRAERRAAVRADAPNVPPPLLTISCARIIPRVESVRLAHREAASSACRAQRHQRRACTSFSACDALSRISADRPPCATPSCCACAHPHPYWLEDSAPVAVTRSDLRLNQQRILRRARAPRANALLDASLTAPLAGTSRRVNPRLPHRATSRGTDAATLRCATLANVASRRLRRALPSEPEQRPVQQVRAPPTTAPTVASEVASGPSEDGVCPPQPSAKILMRTSVPHGESRYQLRR